MPNHPLVMLDTHHLICNRLQDNNLLVPDLDLGLVVVWHTSLLPCWNAIALGISRDVVLAVALVIARPFLFQLVSTVAGVHLTAVVFTGFTSILHILLSAVIPLLKCQSAHC